MPEPLLQVNNLKMYFPVRSGIFLRQAGWVKAVDDVSFSIYPGETLGLVGESGCGKSTIGKSIVRLLKPTGGSIQFNGKNIATLSQRKMRPLRPHIQMVFQDPAESLNQRQSIGQIVAEPFVIHRMGTPAARREWVRGLLDRVGMPDSAIDRFPFEFSGGQRQRIGVKPRLRLPICRRAQFTAFPIRTRESSAPRSISGRKALKSSSEARLSPTARVASRANPARRVISSSEAAYSRTLP